MSSRFGAVRAPRAWALLGIAGLLASLCLPAVTRAATGDPVLLNEILVSHTGADDTEYVELYGVPGASLAGMSLLVVEGDSSGGPGNVDHRLDFPSGAHLGGNGFYLVGNPVGLGSHYSVVPDLAIGTDWFENGSQTVALVASSSAPAEQGSVTGGETVYDAVGLTDAGWSDVWFFGAPVVGPDDGFLPAGARRVADGVDTDTVADWVFADDLLGSANTPTPATAFDAAPTADCGAPFSVESGTPASVAVSATDPDGLVTTFTLQVAPDPGTVTLGPVTPATAPGAPATTSVEVAAATPPGSYTATVTAMTSAAPPQQAVCTLAISVTDPPPAPAPPAASPFDELSAQFAACVANGDVASPKAHLFVARLARIDRFMHGHQHRAAAAQLRAFANQLSGMSPRWIAPGAAEALADAARRVARAL